MNKFESSNEHQSVWTTSRAQAAWRSIRGASRIAENITLSHCRTCRGEPHGLHIALIATPGTHAVAKRGAVITFSSATPSVNAAKRSHDDCCRLAGQLYQDTTMRARREDRGRETKVRFGRHESERWVSCHFGSLPSCIAATNTSSAEPFEQEKMRSFIIRCCGWGCLFRMSVLQGYYLPLLDLVLPSLSSLRKCNALPCPFASGSLLGLPSVPHCCQVGAAVPLGLNIPRFVLISLRY
jgi:hypothetical protein